MDINIGAIDLATLPQSVRQAPYLAQLEAEHQARRLRMQTSMLQKPTPLLEESRHTAQKAGATGSESAENQSQRDEQEEPVPLAVPIEKPKEWWEHFIPAVGGIVKFKMALREVAFVRDVPEDEIKSSQRSREQVRARQLLCLLAKRHTKRSLPEIGRLVGGRDHTTVLHSVRKAEQLMFDDAEFASDVVFIEHRLGVVRWGDAPPESQVHNTHETETVS